MNYKFIHKLIFLVTTVLTILVAPFASSEELIGDRYRDNGDGTVTDALFGLQWMRCSLGQQWTGSWCKGSTENYSWKAAFDAARALNHEGFAGHQDWRLPKQYELIVLVHCSTNTERNILLGGESCRGDYSRPTIDEMAFPDTPIYGFWTSSSVGHDPDFEYAEAVNFETGNDSYAGKNAPLSVRLVRGHSKRLDRLYK